MPTHRLLSVVDIHGGEIRGYEANNRDSGADMNMFQRLVNSSSFHFRGRNGGGTASFICASLQSLVIIPDACSTALRPRPIPRIRFRDGRANINHLTSWQTRANTFSRVLAKLAAFASAGQRVRAILNAPKGFVPLVIND